MLAHRSDFARNSTVLLRRELHLLELASRASPLLIVSRVPSLDQLKDRWCDRRRGIGFDAECRWCGLLFVGVDPDHCRVQLIVASQPQWGAALSFVCVDLVEDSAKSRPDDLVGCSHLSRIIAVEDRVTR